MPDKKVNVLSQLLCVFKPKKNPCEDIVAAADRVVEDYIVSRNKLIHRRYKRKNRVFPLFFLLLALPLCLAFIINGLI